MTYGTTARMLHWIVAVLVIAMFTAGLIMTEKVDRAVQDTLFVFHKSGGAILIPLILFRLAWRLTHPAPPLPASVPPIQRLAAETTHWLLYLALLVMLASGYVRVTAGGFPIDILNWLGIPPLLDKDEALAQNAKWIHATAKYALGGLVLLHVGAALHHGLIKRDGIFSRMWPPVAPGV